MNYDEIIAKINAYIKFGSKLGLERMEKLMELLGNPQEDMKIIHVAGTNGKGSVCRFLYEMLMANGYSTGMYTSPFLERFTERIEANGKEISEEELSYCAEKVIDKAQEVIKCGFESPTEFEVVTAIGFIFFKRMKVDYLVLEVGLGGRGDATNIIKNPLVSVITSISFDHTEYLGNTLAEIAQEKAGIVKPHAPVISQVAERSAKEAIIQICAEKNAPFYDVTSFEVSNLLKLVDHYEFGVKLESRCEGHNTLQLDYPNVVVSMIGQHQITNAVTALSAMKILEQEYRLSLHDEALLKGLKRAILKGRFEILMDNPFVIIDGAHNEAGIMALKNVMEQHFKGKKVLTVMGILQDKITDKLFEDIASFTDKFIATMPENPRSLEVTYLTERLLRTGKPCISIPGWKEAVREAMTKSCDYDVVIFAGSLYLIGAVRGEILRCDRYQAR